MLFIGKPKGRSIMISNSWRSALGNLGCSKKSTENILVNRSWDKRSESVKVWPHSSD